MEDFTLLRWHSGTQKWVQRAKQRDQIDNEARFLWKSIVKTKHQSLTNLAFMRLVPGADRVVRHICIRCIHLQKWPFKSCVIAVVLLQCDFFISFNLISRVSHLTAPWTIGKTKHRLHDRKTEHIKGITSTCHASAIADHVTSTGHNLKWDHFEILAKGRSNTHCKIKETLLIQELKPTLNDTVSSEKLYLC